MLDYQMITKHITIYMISLNAANKIFGLVSSMKNLGMTTGDGEPNNDSNYKGR